MAYVGAASVAMQAYQGEQTRKGQSAAQSQARTDADQNMNRVNPKLPNVTDLGRANFNATSGGSGSTMLTGPAGVAPNNMLLGRSTLLGG